MEDPTQETNVFRSKGRGWAKSAAVAAWNKIKSRRAASQLLALAVATSVAALGGYGYVNTNQRIDPLSPQIAALQAAAQQTQLDLQGIQDELGAINSDYDDLATKLADLGKNLTALGDLVDTKASLDDLALVYGGLLKLQDRVAEIDPELAQTAYDTALRALALAQSGGASSADLSALGEQIATVANEGKAALAEQQAKTEALSVQAANASAAAGQASATAAAASAAAIEAQTRSDAQDAIAAEAQAALTLAQVNLIAANEALAAAQAQQGVDLTALEAAVVAAQSTADGAATAATAAQTSADEAAAAATAAQTEADQAAADLATAVADQAAVNASVATTLEGLSFQFGDGVVVGGAMDSLVGWTVVQSVDGQVFAVPGSGSVSFNRGGTPPGGQISQVLATQSGGSYSLAVEVFAAGTTVGVDIKLGIQVSDLATGVVLSDVTRQVPAGSGGRLTLPAVTFTASTGPVILRLVDRSTDNAALATSDLRVSNVALVRLS